MKEHLDEIGASGDVAERDQVLYYFTLHDFNNDGFEDLFICLVHHLSKGLSQCFFVLGAGSWMAMS